jgi:hypothetical protein
MEPEHIPKQLMDYTPTGTRSVGSQQSAYLTGEQNRSKGPSLDVDDDI